MKTHERTQKYSNTHTIDNRECEHNFIVDKSIAAWIPFFSFGIIIFVHLFFLWPRCLSYFCVFFHLNLLCSDFLFSHDSFFIDISLIQIKAKIEMLKRFSRSFRIPRRRSFSQNRGKAHKLILSQAGGRAWVHKALRCKWNGTHRISSVNTTKTREEEKKTAKRLNCEMSKKKK